MFWILITTRSWMLCSCFHVNRILVKAVCLPFSHLEQITAQRYLCGLFETGYNWGGWEVMPFYYAGCMGHLTKADLKKNL